MEIIASKHYSPDDVKIYLKRKVKNLGLLNKTIPYPGTCTTAYGLATMTDRIMLICFDGANPDFYRCDGDMNILQQIDSMTDGVGIRGTCFYDNQYFASNEVVHKVWYIDADDNYVYIGDATGVSGSADAQWSSPHGLAFSLGGQLHVCDNANHRVKQYDYGINITNASLTGAYYMDVDADGNIYVGTGADNKIYKYDKDLGVIANFAIGNAGYYVTGVIYDAVLDVLLIAKGAEGIYTCTKTGADEALLIPSVLGKGFTVDADYVYVPGTNSYVTRYDRITGTDLGGIYLEATYTETLHRLKIYDGYLYALMPVLGKVLKVPLNDFTADSVTTVITGLASNHFTFFDIDPRGLIYMTDVTAHLIQKQYGAIGVSNWGAADLTSPRAIKFNYYNNQIIVCDPGSNKIYNYKYGLLKAIMVKSGGGAGTGHGEFTLPMDICFDAENYFYVKDVVSGVSRIQKFEYTRAWNLQWSTPAYAYNGLMYSPTENRIYVNSLYFAYTYTTTGTAERYFTYNDFVGVTTVASITAGILYVIGFDNLYLYEITPDYETDWMDISKYVFKNTLKIKYTTDESNFSLGKITLGDIDIVVNNEADKWDFENNMASIFYDVDGLYQRNQSMIKIELDSKELVRGLIDGKNIENEENLIKFKIYTPFKYMDTILSTNIKPSLSDGDNISDVLLKLVNNRYFENIIEYNAADIDIFYDAVINDVSELPDTTLEILTLLSKLGAFKFGLYEGYKFFAHNVIDKVKEGAIDYLITQNNLLGVESYNNGEQRLFGQVNVNYAGEAVASFVLPDGVRVSFNEDRIVDIEALCLTSAVIAQACADTFEYSTTWPSKEIEIRLPLLNYTGNLYAKTFGFNIFDDTRGLKFNSPSLNADTAALPDKNTAMDDSGRIIYYPLNIEHRIGKEMCTIIKLKEFIDDSV